MVLFWIAAILRLLDTFAMRRSAIFLFAMEIISVILLFSILNSRMFSEEAANRYYGVSMSKHTLHMAEESRVVWFTSSKVSKSRYLTVLSVEPLARVR